MIFKYQAITVLKQSRNQSSDNDLITPCYPLIISKSLSRSSTLECVTYHHIADRNSLFCLCFTGPLQERAEGEK